MTIHDHFFQVMLKVELRIRVTAKGDRVLAVTAWRRSENCFVFRNLMKHGRSGA